MATIHLREYQRTAGVRLSREDIALLRQCIPSVAITPNPEADNLYDLTPGSVVGAVELGEIALHITPKVEVDRLFFLLSYSLDPKHWFTETFAFPPDASLFEAVVIGFSRLLHRALERGLLQGYRTVEEALPTMRGRVRVEDQMQRRFGLAPPVEVRYDDFTDDIEENRLLRAALHRLSRIQIRFENTRQILRRAESLLQRVQLADYRPQLLPTITYTRLNEHYRLPVELARLILRSTSIELAHGIVRSSAFLVDMNKVFEDFVVVALREALGLTGQTLVQGGDGHALWLDGGHRVPLKPDISWWDGDRCFFVGDVKYKWPEVGGVPNADLYQLLAYSIAADLPGGLLIYAAGERPAEIHDVAHVEKQLQIAVIDLGQPPEAILNQVREVAACIVGLRRVTLSPHAA
jgi:5-methylcytosine-specific restriction enzyme subunit McrC